jgi:hypothetical protein
VGLGSAVVEVTVVAKRSNFLGLKIEHIPCFECIETGRTPELLSICSVDEFLLSVANDLQE